MARSTKKTPRTKAPPQADTPFGARLRVWVDRYVEETGVTVAALAEAVGGSREGLYKIFKNPRSFGIEAVRKLVERVIPSERERMDLLFLWVTERAVPRGGKGKGGDGDHLPEGLMRAFRDIEAAYQADGKDAGEIRDLLVRSVFYPEAG